MLLVRYCVIYFLLVCSLTALSQQAYKGLVYDTKTGGPVPFATLRLVGKDGGMIANEDGRYYLPAGVFMKTDTVMVSCVGYQSRKILIRSLRDTSNIGLKPMIYDLKEVNIVAKGQPDYLYRMVYDICQKYRKTDEKIYSKAYFSFLSECNYEPLEIIEAYCNASVSCGDGISQLTPKNGRIGLTLRNFWSLNTTDILKHLLPFTNGGHYTIPLSAGNLSYHHFKQLYYVNLVKHSGEGSNVNYVLRLVPKGDSVKLFESTVYLNEHDNTIEKIEYSARNLDFYYLRAQVHGDRVDSVNLSWLVSFDNTDNKNPKISRMSLDYSLLYIEQTDNLTTRLSANAELIFYDYNKPYLNSLGYTGDQPNDYQRIMSIPYDSIFWIYPGVTPESKKQSRFRDFFRSNGVLLNYNSGLNKFVRSVYLPWTSERNLEFYELGTAPPASKTTYIPAISGKTDQRRGSQILGIILINPVDINDSLHISSATLVNARASFMSERQSYRTTAVINIIFDLYELKRREIVNRFHSMKYGSEKSWNEFKDLYEKELVNLQDSIRLFYNETWEGTNVEMIRLWYDHVSAELGVKRTDLIRRMMVEDQDKKKRKKPKSR